MGSLVPSGETPVSRVGSGTILTYRTLLDVDGFCEALLSDLPSEKFGDAYRDLGLAHVSFWVQRDPDAAIARWEGRDIDTMLERFAASSNPVLARWRGQLRVFSGPQEAESFWDASRHRLLSWGTDEQGAESEITVCSEPRQVDMYRRLANEFQQDPSLFGLLDRVRRSQGFTRIETWHQQKDGDEVILNLIEAHDLKGALAQIAAENNELDKRSMKVVRAVLLQAPSPSPVATLLARWHA
jgi:hypothetical protein